MDFYEKTISTENIYKGKIIKVDVETVELPNGKISKREIVRHPGAVAIVAYKDENTILLVEQFRKPIEKVILEIPAGKLELNEDIEVCGRRELEEETGYKAEKFEYLGKIYTSAGFSNEEIHIFKATELYKGIIGGDEDEFIDVKEASLEEIKDMIKNGRITDAKTISALMYL